MSGVPLKVIKDWKEGMTQEERERVIGEQKLTEEQVATLDATAHARALAEAAGDRTLTLEEEVVEINRQIEKLGEADEAEAVQMLDAELLAEEEAASGESPKAAEETPKDGEGSPRAEVPAEAKPEAGGGEAGAGRELDALRVRAAELDDRLRAKGLRKAERAKISEELSGVRARMDELSGGNLVLFSRGEAAVGRPALSPTKAALRDRLLLKIAQTAGIRIVRERSAHILGSARNVEVRRRLGGYMGESRYSLEEAFPATAEEREGIEREAKAKGTWLKAPNGNPTKLTPEQWVTVRTRAFKEWFGDWEKAARIEKLRQSDVLETTGEEYGRDYTDRATAKQWMKDHLRGAYTNKDTGEKIEVSNVGINEVLSHGTTNESHMRSLAAIPRMLENSIFIDEAANSKGNSKYDRYRYYAVGLRINGEDYTAKLVVGVKNGARYYDHRLTQIEKGALIDSLNRLSNSVAENQAPDTSGISNALSSVLQVNSSKIVDGNGEPLVVYHGTDADFTVFDRAKTRATMDIQGNFFSPWEDDARGYGSNVRRFFLNLRNPADENTGYHSLHEFEGQNGAGVKARERLVALGYDGVNNGGEEFIAFLPEQIKSATENVGTFDAGNPDIRYSRETLKHGSPHMFAAEEGAPFGRFRDDKMGSGEGAQAFGWGHYLTNREGIAKSYANIRPAVRTRQDLPPAQRDLVDLFLINFVPTEVGAVGLSLLPGGKGEKEAREKLKEYAFNEKASRDFADGVTPDDVVGILDNPRQRAQLELNAAELMLVSVKKELGRYARNKQLLWATDYDSLLKEKRVLDDLIASIQKKYPPKVKHSLYTAEIDTGEQDANLLDWIRPMTAEQENRLFAQAERELIESDMVHFKAAFTRGRLTAKQVHKSYELGRLFGSPKEISKFLHRAGFIGHKFPAQSFGSGDYSKGTNYVIYSGEDIAITDAVRWLRDGEGVVYGYWDEGRGELHLNEDFADFDTPLHEWAHVWLSWVRKVDARKYASSVAFDLAENFLQTANRGEGIIAPTDGAHDGEVSRAGAEHGGQPRFVNPADGDGGAGRGVDHFAHCAEPERRVGNFLRRRGVDGTDADVVGSGGARGGDLRGRVRGESENFQRREAFPRGGQRHVVLSEMHAVGFRFRGDFGIVVHDEERARSRSDAANVFRGFEDAFPRRALHAQLNEAQSRAHGGVRAGFMARRGIRDDEVKAEGIFHEGKKEKTRERGDRARRPGTFPPSSFFSASNLRR